MFCCLTTCKTHKYTQYINISLPTRIKNRFLWCIKHLATTCIPLVGMRHCWMCKQVTSTHCEGCNNTPPLFLASHLPTVNLWPLCNPFTPLCGDTAEPPILPSCPARLLLSLLCPPACSYDNAVIMLHFTASFFLCLLAPLVFYSVLQLHLQVQIYISSFAVCLYNSRGTFLR